MHIAILATNTDESDFSQRYPLDGAKFIALLAPLRPAWRFSVHVVKDSDFPGGGTDTILDFSSRQGDKLAVNGIDAIAGTAVDDKFVWLGTGEFTQHAGELRLAGSEAGRALVHVLIGMIIGALIALDAARPDGKGRPLAVALTGRANRLGEAFRRVVFAQIRISALNTTLTAIYVAVILPSFGVQLPFTKTIIAITFVVGLMPVIGNLISNSVIVVVSLSASLSVAIASLAFLVVIHKLEYFVNARIVGSRIHARAWELLIAMLVMEAAFGISGLIAAPIYYAYLKHELGDRALV